MGFPITVRLYGTNIQPTGSVATKSTLDAGGTNYPYWEFSAHTINSAFIYENENRTDLANKKISKNLIRPTFEVTVAPLLLPTTTTELQTFYKTNVLSKRYHYFWFNSYTLPSASVASTQVLAVAVIDCQITPNYERGGKDIILTLEKMYGE